MNGSDGSNSSSYLFYDENEVDFLYFLSVLFSLPTNIYVIWLIVTGTGNGLAAEFFSLNLSICEIFICVESVCLFIVSRFKTLWIVISFLDGFATTGRPLFQCLICVERYLAVVHPVTFLKSKPLRYRLICCAFVWVASLVSSGFNVIYALFQSEMFFIFLCVQFFLFLSVELFCCWAVLRALKQSGPGDRNREREEENHMKKRAFHLILIITVTSFIIYTPYAILMAFMPSTEFSYTILNVGSFLFLLAGLVQPLVFLYRVRKLPFIKSF